MVVISQVLGYASKAKTVVKKLRRNFIDRLRLHVTGGSGGSGLPRYGGIGGTGGNVNLVAKQGLRLKDVKLKLMGKKLKAYTGGDSTSKGIIGVPGKNLDIHVPIGITVYTENSVVLGEINTLESKLTVAKGGIGGCPQTGFCGLKGDSRIIILDLKLIADVGLIGFPNAGKSTFLSLISAAKPKIANYPFTTIQPQVGIVKYPDYRAISIADLPGLIEGAHVNVGMGHKFLKHVERTKMLLFIADIQGFQLAPAYPYRNCLETIVLLNKEIELYKPDLLEMPSMLIINKMDTKEADNLYKDIEPHLNDLSTFISTCPEEIQPTRPVQFDIISKASLIKNNKKEINSIKVQIRELLDKSEERKLLEEGGDSAEEKLLEKIKQQTRRNVPTLI